MITPLHDKEVYAWCFVIPIYLKSRRIWNKVKPMRKIIWCLTLKKKTHASVLFLETRFYCSSAISCSQCINKSNYRCILYHITSCFVRIKRNVEMKFLVIIFNDITIFSFIINIFFSIFIKIVLYTTIYIFDFNSRWINTISS